MALGIIPRAIHNTTNPLFEVLTGLSPYRLAARLPKSPFFEVSARNRACGSLLRVVTYTLGTELSIIRFLHTYALMESTAQYWKPVWETLERGPRGRKRLPRCRTPGEAAGRSGANSELCARCRAVIVANSDAQKVPITRDWVRNHSQTHAAASKTTTTERMPCLVSTAAQPTNRNLFN